MRDDTDRPFDRPLTRQEIAEIAGSVQQRHKIQLYMNALGRRYWVGRRDEKGILLVGERADKLFEDHSETALTYRLRRVHLAEYMGQYQPLVNWLRQQRTIREEV